MPRANRVWTINDLSDENYSDQPNLYKQPASVAATDRAVERARKLDDKPVDSTSSTSSTAIPCHHLPSLPNAQQAKTLLGRIMAEFEPIIRRRNYNIRSVSEFCCCGDGLDSVSRRKRRKQANNLLGYNQTSWNSNNRNSKSHTIHIRLRHAANHSHLMQYEDVAGTMAHELAHCEVSPHNQKFYKLMDEIIEEHASLMASKLTQNGLPMLVFGTNGRKLGGNLPASRDNHNQLLPKNVPRKTGHILGGDSSFTQWMTPREAAVAAADARRRQVQMRQRGELCCRPCMGEGKDEEEDILSVSSASIDNHVTRQTSEKKRPAVLENAENRRPRKTNSGVHNANNHEHNAIRADVIDLTGDDENCSFLDLHVLDFGKKWPCQKCTFLNMPSSTACHICLWEPNG